MTDFFRFPHTPHLAWQGEGQPRDDKILSSDEVAGLLSGDLVVEEKIDGANLGFSVSEDGDLRAQNRGDYLARDHCHAQFRPLRSWLGPREHALIDALWPDLMLFGEWCVAVHSVQYDRLPDWFLGFDVYDRAEGYFWDTRRRDMFLVKLGLASVPRLATGQFSLEALVALLDGSRVGSAPMEGLVVRREADGWTAARAKLVRASFAQSIEEHWSRGSQRRNALAGGTSPWH
ncbi:MAG: RNA ligase family protein [Candidatus Schekmanbacteria bacterium]|nr:RNA ligase family protein [Candidatus Schekmanbacteria bacterium]